MRFLTCFRAGDKKYKHTTVIAAIRFETYPNLKRHAESSVANVQGANILAYHRAV